LSHSLAHYVSHIEPLLILLLAPFFIFPRPDRTPWLMLIVPLLWLCRWLARGRLTVRTPLDLPLLILLAMVLVSLWATFDPALSFPKLCGVFLGITLFYALVNSVRTERGVWLTTSLLLVSGAAVAGVSLVGTQWSGGKVPMLYPFLAPFYQRLPPLLRGVPRAEEGFSANQVGGTLCLFIPLAAALLLYQVRHPRRALRWTLSTLGLAGVLVLTIGVLLLTQSRQAYLSVVLALLVLGAFQGRWSRVAAIAALIAGAGLVAWYGPEKTAQAIFGVRSLDMLAGYASWAGRVEIWNRSLRVLWDHPLTGIGFDTLFCVIHARYPTFLIVPGRDLTHAHNIFLQAALNLGLPGLAAFVWLLAAFGWMLWRVWRGTTFPAYRTLVIGLFSGLLAHLIFGLADAVALGAKPGVFIWAYLGLGAALWASEQGGGGAEKRRRSIVRRLTSMLRSRFTFHDSRFWSLGIGLLVILSLFGWGYGRLARARTWLSLIEADLTAMQTLAREGPQAIAPWQPEELLRATRSDLLGLEAEFALPLALASHLGWLPGYGADLEAAPALLQMGLSLTVIGEDVLEPLHPLLALSEEDAAGDEGVLEAVVGTFQSARPQLTETLVTLEEVRRTRQAIRTARLSPWMGRWVAQFDQMLPLLEDSVRGALALPELLGRSEPRTYLVLIQNDDELRPTGGFISGAAWVVLEEGRVVELTFEDSYAVDDFSQPYPDPPVPLREIMGAQLWLFRDSNWSPDFPTSARAAIELYRLRYDVEIDGVLALDQQALQSFVASLEPLEIAEYPPDAAYPQPLTGENVIQAVRESWAPSEDEGFTNEWWRRRKDFMGRLLTEAVRKLQDEPGEVNLMSLAWAAVRASEERHLFVYVPEAEVLHQAGWDGALLDAPGDYLMVVDANLGFNKVNPYVTESLSYTVDLRDPSRPQATLIILHRHNAPETGDPETSVPCLHEPRYDLTYEQMMHRCYWDYVRIYVPRGSRLLEATPHPVPGSMLLTGEDLTGEVQVLPDEAGRTVFATFLVLAPGEWTETRFVYELPSGAVEPEGNTWRYTLRIQKQGGTSANEVQVALALPAEAKVVSISPPPTEREGNVLLYRLLLRTDIDLEVHLQAP